MPDGDAIADAAAGRWRVRHLAEVDSTNRYVLDATRAGEPPGLVVTADHQSAGRGRLDRAWVAVPGESLLASLSVEVAAGDAPLLPLAAGLALAEAVEAVAGIQVLLKWPNDLVVDERKLAGVLCEAMPGAPGSTVAVVGMGCNVRQTSFPPELPDATSIAIAAGVPVEQTELLHAYLDRLGRCLDALDTVVPSVWLRLATLGRAVRVDRPSGALHGTAVALGDAGQLVVCDADGRDVEVFAGDVTHLRVVD